MNLIKLWKLKRLLEKESNVGKLFGQILLLDFPFLVGLRTKLGILGMVTDPFINMITSDAYCTQFPKVCASVKAVSTWLVFAGIRGAVQPTK